jgi:ATP-dependent helicase/nuclease subunit A
MRGRIQAAIRRRLESFASPTPRLTRQLALVEHASISTIHGFCSRLIRQNFNAAGVDPNFSVIDGDEAMLLRGEIVRQLFDDAYEHDGTGKFQEFIDAYGDGNDQRLADLVTSGYELICSLDRPGQWLRSALDAISESAAQPLAKSKLGQRHLDEVRQWLDRLSANCAAAIKSISSLGAFRPYIDRLREYSAVIAEWKSTFDRRGYDELVAAFQRFDPDRLPGVSSTTPNKDRAKQSVDSIKGQMCGPEIARLLNFNESEWREGQKAIGPHVQIFLNLLGGFERRYKEAKARLRSLDYSDLERKALELLREPDAREPSAIARLCHREFKYVCVDEYQDVNEIQDAILNLVSTECVAGEGHYRPNLFAVGDVKQSIYRFRLAEPQRFLERMRLFRRPNAIGQVIDLQENFRSRPPLLEAINQVFLRLMTKEAAEIDYRDGHQLNPAPQPQFPAGGLKGAPIELHILPSQRPADEDEPTDMVAVDYEAMLCAQRIEKLVEKKVLIADNGVLRPARYGDVVVLLRAMKHKAQAFATTFRKRGILDDQPIADLSLLKGANITNLSIMRTPVADLSPLRGMKLTALRLSGTQVTDLTPLKGMPITSLNISGTQVSDLTSLAGMPLRTLSMAGCDQIIDLSPLADTSGTLESLILPPNAKDIELLRNFPNLKRLGYQYDSGIKGPNQTTQEFWAAFDKAHRTATTQP